jgi:hypothetical protein
MPVRPVTEAERHQAFGDPFTGILVAFGATQGLLHHLSFNGARLTSNWFPNKTSFATFTLFVGAGVVLGGATGIIVFGDAGLRRLIFSHRQDQALEIESRKFTGPTM